MLTKLLQYYKLYKFYVVNKMGLYHTSQLNNIHWASCVFELAWYNYTRVHNLPYESNINDHMIKFIEHLMGKSVPELAKINDSYNFFLSQIVLKITKE